MGMVNGGAPRSTPGWATAFPIPEAVLDSMPEFFPEPGPYLTRGSGLQALQQEFLETALGVSVLLPHGTEYFCSIR